MTVEPACVAPGVPFTIRLGGEWPDACPPNTASALVFGQVIDITTRREPPPGVCLTVITPWTLPVGVGGLAAGTYSVYAEHVGAHAAPRTFIGTVAVDPACGCYANCDGSTTAPFLNVADFTCFLQQFAAAQPLPPAQQVTHYANCDGSTTSPVLNVADFTCFLQRFAAGCSAP